MQHSHTVENHLADCLLAMSAAFSQTYVQDSSRHEGPLQSHRSQSYLGPSSKNKHENRLPKTSPEISFETLCIIPEDESSGWAFLIYNQLESFLTPPSSDVVL